MLWQNVKRVWRAGRTFAAGGAMLLCAANLATSEEPRLKVVPPLGPNERVIVIGEGEAPRIIRALEGVGDKPKVVEAPTKLSKYWLGLECSPIGPAIRAQLKLEYGLVVGQVVAESPAAKAGVKENDILIQFGETKLTTREDIFNALDAAQEKETEVKLIREGKETTLKVKPALRPAKPQGGGKLEAEEGEAPEAVLRGLLQGEGGKGPMNMFFMRPGVLLHGDLLKAFPMDLSVGIAKTGDKPARITVKKGDKTWEVDETKIDELPEEVRPYVKNLLGRHEEFDLRVLPGGGLPLPGGKMHWFGAENEKLGEQLEKQFQELHKMIDDVQKRIDDPPSVQALRKEIEALRKELLERRKEQPSEK